MALVGINNFRSGQSPNTNNIKALGNLFGALMTEGVWENGLTVTASSTPDGFVNIGTGHIVFSIGTGSSLVFYNDAVEKLAVTPNPNNDGSIVYSLVYAQINVRYDLGGLPTATLAIAVGTVNTDPVLPDNSTNGVFCVPLARIAKSYSATGIVVSSEIITTGNTNNTNVELIRPISRLNGSTRALQLTESQRTSQDWPIGTIVLQKESLDANNKLFVNISTTTTSLWKQIVLLAQLSSQWVLLLPKALGTANGTTTIAENEGTGSFTLPANFWGVGTTLEITDTAQIQGTITTNAFIQTNNVNINGTLLYSSALTCNYNIYTAGSPGYYSFYTTTLLTFTKKTTITCISATSTTAQLQISSQNIANPSGLTTGLTNNFSTTSTTTIQTITQNVPMVISTNFVKTGITNWLTTTTNNLTVFTIQKQT